MLLLLLEPLLIATAATDIIITSEREVKRARMTAYGKADEEQEERTYHIQKWENNWTSNGMWKGWPMSLLPAWRKRNTVSTRESQ